ncbi:MAG: V-type ATP synthase subunit I, partial [Candidatus Ratteibacteria bacterium]
RVKKEINWAPLSSDISLTGVPVEQYRKKIEELKSELIIVDSQIQEIVKQRAQVLSKISLSVEMYEKLTQMKKHAVVTDMTMALSGWVPEKESQSVSETVRMIDPVSYCECIPAEKTGIPYEEIPVSIKHNRFLKPFELIVQTYGIPRYGCLDPTIFVACSFLLMFGAMFGDIGHGMIFVLLGLLFLWRFKAAMKQASWLMVYVGLSSMVFGLLYGSFFGIEFHPLWINPMEDITTLFRSCVIFGIIILTAGIILNIINHAINKNRDAILFDKAGLFSGMIFWAGVALAASYFAKAGSLIMKVLALLLVTGVAVIFFRSVVDAIKHREGILVGFIEGVLHIFEIMLGYLANTVSFIRISAFALNHFVFFMTIFAISDMIKKTGAGWLSWLAIVFGNIFVIVLEGLVVLIQSLRLNYYEFFSRFFATGKNIYQPVVLKGMIEKVDEYFA